MNTRPRPGEFRLHDAMVRSVEGIDLDDHWESVVARARVSRRRRRAATGGGVALAVAALVAAVALLLPGQTDRQVRTVTPIAPPTTAGGNSPATTAPHSSPPLFPYLPLFPFSSQSQAQQWEAGYKANARQPWHLDAGLTAVAFAQHLGFTGITQAISSGGTATDERVSVGYTVGGSAHVAAVVHLVRFGADPSNAPWEVVGTDDTNLSLTSPAYGSRAGSPLQVGGTVTGVDESIRVEVIAGASDTPLGTACCLPAGGQASPWRTTVTFSVPPGEVLTVVASTGGHVAPVERFAVTGIRT